MKPIINNIPEVKHLNCVKIVSPIKDNVCGHCLLLTQNNKHVLVEAGIGLQDVLNPLERIGKQIIDLVGFCFDEKMTAIRQIEQLGLDPNNVTDIIVSHLDNDHIGGLADFPNATVHISHEEFLNYHLGNIRYLKQPMSHQPKIKTHIKSMESWFGFEARKVVTAIDVQIFLIPLFGHTRGHCGVALNVNNQWLFYVGDAYYLRDELNVLNHPVNELAKLRADDNELRLDTLKMIRTFIHQHPDISVFCYHDIDEFESITI